MLCETGYIFRQTPNQRQQTAFVGRECLFAQHTAEVQQDCSSHHLRFMSNSWTYKQRCDHSCTFPGNWGLKMEAGGLWTSFPTDTPRPPPPPHPPPPSLHMSSLPCSGSSRDRRVNTQAKQSAHWGEQSDSLSFYRHPNLSQGNFQPLIGFWRWNHYLWVLGALSETAYATRQRAHL